MFYNVSFGVLKVLKTVISRNYNFGYLFIFGFFFSQILNIFFFMFYSFLFLFILFSGSMHQKCSNLQVQQVLKTSPEQKKNVDFVDKKSPNWVRKTGNIATFPNDL